MRGTHGANNVRDMRYCSAGGSTKVQYMGSWTLSGKKNHRQRANQNELNSVQQQLYIKRDNVQHTIHILSTPPRIAAATFDLKGFHTLYSTLAPSSPCHPKRKRYQLEAIQRKQA